MPKSLKRFIISFASSFILNKSRRKEFRLRMRRKWNAGKEKEIHTLSALTSQTKGKALVAYLPNVYGRENDDAYMLWHQNRREQLVIGRVLQKAGYEVKIVLWSAPELLDDDSYDLVFGLGPTFEEACRKNPTALKIYYGTGAYPDFHQSAVAMRAANFNTRHQTNIIPARSIGTESSEVVEFADTVFQIGTTFTKETFPKEYQDKVRLINQSSNFIGECDLSKKIKVARPTNFLWLGSGGSILKGLDLLLDYFSEHPELNLYVIGNIDRELLGIYENVLRQSPNIHCTGFMNTQPSEFREILYKCGFLIFPSCTEGCPGSVITAMRMGCIPIVSRPASFEEIQDCGFLLEEISFAEIEKAVEWATQLPLEKFEILIPQNISYSLARWNLERFEEEITFAFEDTIRNFESA